MIVNIRDPQTLRQIDVTIVSIYLQQNGWHEKHVADKVAFWIKTIEDNEEAEISLPLDRKLADFHFRISEILQILAIVEHRLPEEIFNDLVNLNAQKTKENIHISAKKIKSTAKIIQIQDLNDDLERPQRVREILIVYTVYMMVIFIVSIISIALVLIFQAVGWALPTNHI
jgi:hypothetical protein